jgi:type II secretory pathway component PulM
VDPFVQQILLTLSPIVIPVLIAYLTVLVKKAFEKMPAKQRATLAAIVQTAVNAVEQTSFGSETPEEKKLAAMNMIEASLKHFGLNVPQSVIEPFLEEAVLILNMAKGDAAPAPLVAPNVAPGGRK